MNISENQKKFIRFLAMVTFCLMFALFLMRANYNILSLIRQQTFRTYSVNNGNEFKPADKETVFDLPVWGKNMSYIDFLVQSEQNIDGKAKLEIFENNKSIYSIEEDDISEEEISEIEKWVEFKCEDALRKMNIANLPDSIGYGEDIEILGIDGQKLFLKIDEININPSAGDKEWIDINLSDEKEIIASGIVELTVGYIEYDEDGGVADGLADEIDYSYHSIIEQLDNFILEQNEYMKTEKTILEILEEAIE